MIRSPAGFDGGDRIKRYLDYYQPSYGVMMLSAGQVAAFSPASLFAAGEQGVWYDPSDFSTMFQDSAGTTPVTAVEQPVGLLLDKSQGLTLGPELVTNGDFSSPTGWVTGAGATISGGKANFSAASGYVLFRNSVSGVQPGGYYEVTFTVSGYVSGSIRPYLGATPTFGTAVSANGTYTQRFGPISGSEVGFNSASAFTGAIDDLSVKAITGNHATQATSASRPVLSARVNLLTKTEQFDDAVWTKVGLNAFGSGSIADATTAPNGTLTADLITENTANSTHNLTFAPPPSAFALVAYTAVVYFKRANGIRDAYIQINNNGGGTGGAVAAIFDLGAVSASISTLVAGFTNVSATITGVGSGWYCCVLNLTTVATTTSLGVLPGIYNASRSYTGDGTSGIYIWGADLRVTNDGVGIPAYQRVNTSTDYDTTGFPYYLRFDGTDDSLATASINFSATDKMTVFSGVRKLSDATVQILYELSFDQNVNTGTFNAAPGYSGSGSTTGAFWSVSSKGTLISSATTSATFAAPQTVVQSHIVDISADSLILRLNSTQVASSASDQGPGNFGNYPLYIGRRGGSSLPFNGRIYSLIVRGAASTATEITNTETWVNGKTFAYA
jgi:hypothetical protein